MLGAGLGPKLLAGINAELIGRRAEGIIRADRRGDLTMLYTLGWSPC